MSTNSPISAEPMLNDAGIDVVTIPEGPFAPLVPLSPEDKRGRRKDPLTIVTVSSPGSGMIAQTYALTTNSNGALSPNDPFPILVQSGHATWRRVRLSVPSASPLIAVLVSTNSYPAMANSALLAAGAPDIELTDGDLYVSTANIPNLSQVSLSGWLTVISYVFDPGPNSR